MGPASVNLFIFLCPYACSFICQWCGYNEIVKNFYYFFEEIGSKSMQDHHGNLQARITNPTALTHSNLLKADDN